MVRSQPLVSDEPWKIVEPLLPTPKRRRRYPSRRPIDNPRAFTGIPFVLKTGTLVDAAPELGCGSGVTCWRRLRDWQEAGVWEKLHEAILA